MTARPPMVAAEIWTPVMEAADYRCQCVAHCGTKHGSGRCDLGHTYTRRLHAVSFAETWIEAASDTPDSMLALCPKCHAGVARRSTKGMEPHEQEGLW